MPYIIFFFKIKNCLKDDLFISCDDRIGKMLHNKKKKKKKKKKKLHICSGYVTQVSDPWPMAHLVKNLYFQKTLLGSMSVP